MVGAGGEVTDNREKRKNQIGLMCILSSWHPINVLDLESDAARDILSENV